MVAAMVIMMVVFLAVGMHHGAPGPHDAKAPPEQASQTQAHDGSAATEKKP